MLSKRFRLKKRTNSLNERILFCNRSHQNNKKIIKYWKFEKLNSRWSSQTIVFVCIRCQVPYTTIRFINCTFNSYFTNEHFILNTLVLHAYGFGEHLVQNKVFHKTIRETKVFQKSKVQDKNVSLLTCSLLEQRDLKTKMYQY